MTLFFNKFNDISIHIKEIVIMANQFPNTVNITHAIWIPVDSRSDPTEVLKDWNIYIFGFRHKYVIRLNPLGSIKNPLINMLKSFMMQMFPYHFRHFRYSPMDGMADLQDFMIQKIHDMDFKAQRFKCLLERRVKVR